VTAAAPIPVPDPDSAGYWDALREGTLKLCRCVETGTWIHPPQERSPTGGTVTFEPVSGRGTIFSFIVVRQQTVPGHQTPYVVGVVELDEQVGLRLTGIVDAEPDEVRVGARVRARLGMPVRSDQLADFRAPRFELDMAHGAR
jgi:uncharacterized OB-fold protein